MPNNKKSSRHRSSRSRGSQGDKVETMVVRMNWETLSNVASGFITGQSFLNLNPFCTIGSTTSATTGVSGDNKLIAMGQLFELFRFRKLKLRLLPSALAVTSLEPAGSWNVVVGFTPNPTGALPATYSGALQLPWVTETVCFNADGGTLPSVPKWYTVPKRVLNGLPFKWFKCFGSSPTVPTGAILDEYLQGTLVCGFKSVPVSSTEVVTWGVEIEAVIQFKDFYPTAGPTFDSRFATGVPSYAPAGLAELNHTSLDEEKKEVLKPAVQRSPVTANSSSIEDFVDAWTKAKESEFEDFDSVYAGISKRAI